MLITATCLLSFTLCAAQTPEKNSRRLQPLVPPAANAEPQTGVIAGATATQPVDTGTGPRLLPTQEPLPFAYDRPLLEVDGERIMASELNELVLYYRSFRPGLTDTLLIDAVAALLPRTVLRARYGHDLTAMRAQTEDILSQLRAGRPFAEVAKDFSEDTEAPNPEGRYTFGRQRAVQPFDRVSFTAAPGSGPQPPCLTVYGFHIIEPLSYERGLTPAEDQATMRHILVMYPGLHAMESSGKDVRAWIKEQVAAAKIRVLWPGLENLVPPENRSQIVP